MPFDCYSACQRCNTSCARHYPEPSVIKYRVTFSLVNNPKTTIDIVVENTSRDKAIMEAVKELETAFTNLRARSFDFVSAIVTR